MSRLASHRRVTNLRKAKSAFGGPDGPRCGQAEEGKFANSLIRLVWIGRPSQKRRFHTTVVLDPWGPAGRRGVRQRSHLGRHHMLRTQGVAPNLGADTHLFVTKPDAALGSGPAVQA
jgi:hypothetical protein